MDIDDIRVNTPDTDSDTEPGPIQDDEPEPMEGIEYSGPLGLSTPPNLPVRRPFTIRYHTASRPTPSRTPDRFVFDRNLDVQPRERFMLSSPPQDLNAHDRWSRRQAHTYDAFGPRTNITRDSRLSKSPVRQQASRTPRLFMSSRVGPLGLLTPDSPRDFSQGAVWNVGGLSPASPSDGVRSISNGRGGHITSGTNAPMFRSDFSNRVHDDFEFLHTHEARLSTAMGLDQANRVLDQGLGLLTPVHSPDSDAAGSFIPNVWRNNEWTKPGSPPLLDAPALRDDYYCSLLAYSDTAKCLAVGLGAQVYTWSEVRGVESPEFLGQPFSGHVTSLSFSSTEGERSILAVGRSDGCITLWSPSEVSPRFNHTHRSPISCVCFSPRTFRKASAQCLQIRVQVEYLLVGDEAGHVYLYSVEWPDQINVDIFAWPGSMTVLAR
ncbi:WD40 repeat-like protein, partial [Aureobasidium sp. EXF-8846]